jgi:hypothetical protein
MIDGQIVAALTGWQSVVMIAVVFVVTYAARRLRRYSERM